MVQSKQNARLKQLRRALREPAAPGADRNGNRAGLLMGIEGPKLIAEALRAGLRLDCLFAAQETENLPETLCLLPNIEVLLLPRKILDSALSTETPQPVAALVEPPRWSWEQVINRSREPLVLILAGLQDPGNLGTILRSAEAFGASGVVSLPGTVSAWNPKAVRASAGSVFRVPLVAAGAGDCIDQLRSAGIMLWTTASDGAQPVTAANLAVPAAFLIGNEGNGVPPELAARADGELTIPCPGPVESLNAAVAASVLLYEAARQRSAASGGLAVHRGGRQ